jgi:hypothetical protein
MALELFNQSIQTSVSDRTTKRLAYAEPSQAGCENITVQNFCKNEIGLTGTTGNIGFLDNAVNKIAFDVDFTYDNANDILTFKKWKPATDNANSLILYRTDGTTPVLNLSLVASSPLWSLEGAIISSDANNTTNYIQLKNSTSTNGFKIDNVNEHITINNTENGYIDFKTDNTQALRIDSEQYLSFAKYRPISNSTTALGIYNSEGTFKILNVDSNNKIITFDKLSTSTDAAGSFKMFRSNGSTELINIDTDTTTALFTFDGNLKTYTANSTTNSILLKNSASTNGLTIQNVSNDVTINNGDNGYMMFKTNDTEALRIDSTQYLSFQKWRPLTNSSSALIFFAANGTNSIMIVNTTSRKIEFYGESPLVNMHREIIYVDGFRHLKANSGTHVMTKYAKWDDVTGWASDITSTVGATQQSMDYLGNIIFRSATYAVVTANAAITFNPMLYLKNDGTNGFGIETPQSKLHLHYTTAVETALRLTNSATGSASGDGTKLLIDSSGNSEWNNQESTYSLIKTSGTERIRYFSGGGTSEKVSFWNYIDTSSTADTVGDIREGNLSNDLQTQTCTVANGTKGNGTWVYTEIKKSAKLVDNNMQYSGTVPTTSGAFLLISSNACGSGRISFGDVTNLVYIDFVFDSNGNLSVNNTLGLYSLTAANNTLCFSSNGGNIYIVNEIGSTQNITLVLNYTS